jgi:peptide/nickel transport system substrate-binding protein
MKAKLLSFLVACGALGGFWASDPALAQKSGGVLRVPLGTSIASVSIHEESTIVVLGPMMGVFNNLVMFDQHVPQNTLSSIVSDLASSWSWSEDGKELTFKLRDGVKWHDGKPFTSADVKCTWAFARQFGVTPGRYVAARA